MSNYYEIINVPAKATQSEIEQAINMLESKDIKRTEKLGALFNLRKYRQIPIKNLIQKLNLKE